MLIGVCGCSQARFVSVDPDGRGGVVAIPNDTNRWPCYNRKAAEELMDHKCPQGYVVQNQTEVAIGRPAPVNAPGSHDITTFGVVNIGARMDEAPPELTEIRIRFRAKDALQQPPERAESPPVEPAVTPVSFQSPADPIPVAPGK